MGTRFGISGHRPQAHCLREWWWGDPADGDLSLYHRDGLTIARLVLADGRYWLRSPFVVADGWPYQRMCWPDLEQAKHGAESIALSALPLDPKLDAKIRRENIQGHPMAALRQMPVAP